MTSAWKPDLPDPSQWQPKKSPEVLKSTFRNRCLGVERLIRLRAELERQSNLQNFDAGPGIEDIFRDELDRLLPDRYAVRPGVVSNRQGLNAGDCDVVIFNHLWFPSIRAGATPSSRRFHYPIEGVYGVLEIKQSLTASSLDEAMEKLVMVARLSPPPSGTLLVENRGMVDAGPTPPIFTAVVCAGLAPGESLQRLVDRFIAINGQLKRREVVNALCVLGVGFASWAHGDPPSTAFFGPDETGLHLSPFLLEASEDEAISPFYELVTNLLEQLTGQVLPASGTAVHYGAPQEFRRPEDSTWDLHPDGCTCHLTT